MSTEVKHGVDSLTLGTDFQCTTPLSDRENDEHALGHASDRRLLFVLWAVAVHPILITLIIMNVG